MKCYIRDLKESQVYVTLMAIYGINSLNKKLTHICFSRLRSINEYLVIDWGPKRPSGCDLTSATGVLGRLLVLTPQLASQVGAPASAWLGSRSLLAQTQSSLSSAHGPA